MAQITTKVVKKLLQKKSVRSLTSGTVKNGVNANIPFIPVEHYSVVGPKGVAYVIKNDPSISKKDVCKGKAKRTKFCRK